MAQGQIQFMQLPALQANRLLDFSGVGNALTSVDNKMRYREKQDIAAEERSYQRGRQGASDQRQQVELFGKQAAAIDSIQDPNQRAALWKRIVSKHPNAGSLTPDYLDPSTGPKLVSIEAGQWSQQNDSGKTYEVDGRLVQVAPNGSGVKEIYRAPEKPDPVREMLLQRLQPRGQGQAPAPAAPMLQPQSYQAPAPQQTRNPLLQLATDRAMPVDDRQQAPQGPPQPQVDTTAPNMIETPYGPMSREDAQQLGGAMLLDPKYQAAGKAMLESLQYGKSQLSKPAETQLDERTISAASTLGRLRIIRQQFKPKFQEIPTKLKLFGASWGAALGPKLGGKLSPELRQQLGDFGKYKAAAFDNFNQLLKELSGTAVSAQELSRQKIVQPNPGEGIFDGDDPVTFEAKIDAGERIARAAIARMNFMRNRGVIFNKDTAEQFLRLEDLPGVINKRLNDEAKLFQQSNPQADDQMLRDHIRNVQQREFGI